MSSAPGLEPEEPPGLERTLATKAIWGLGSIADDTAAEALERLAGKDELIVAAGARAQLEK